MQRPLAAVALSLVLAAAAIASGYWIGRESGTDLEAARVAGEQAGQQEGKAAGERHGDKQGFRIGRERTFRSAVRAARAEAETLVPTEPVVPAEPLAPEPSPETAPDGDAGTELEPCIYSPEDLCTPEENARESEIESLCGPGTEAGREQAEELGVEC